MPVQIFMFARTSPSTRTRSCSRQNEMWPIVCPGVSITRKPPTSSPSRSRRATGWGGPVHRGPTSTAEPVRGHPCHDQSLGLHRRGVALAAPERQPERLADRVAGALVVGMRVRERMGQELPPAELPQDPPPRKPGRRVDQHASHHVDIERVRREAVKELEVLGQALHLGLRHHASASHSSRGIIRLPSRAHQQARAESRVFSESSSFARSGSLKDVSRGLRGATKNPAHHRGDGPGRGASRASDPSS